MLFTLLFLNILKHNGVQTIKVISTDPSQSRPREEGLAVISESSIQDLEEFTVCLRFITYNFAIDRPNQVLSVHDFFMLGGFSKSSCQGPEGQCAIVPWKVYGRTNFKKFPGWSPNEWRSVCMSGSSVSQSWNITFDGRKSVSFEYNSYHNRSPENIVLMNVMEGFPHGPLHGAVSDLQVWSRLLQEEELQQWLHCRSDLVGNYLNWATLHLNITGLHTWYWDKDDICSKENSKEKYFHFEHKINFEETRQFCKNLGGEIATVDSSEKYEEMFEGLLGGDGDCSYIYTGYRAARRTGPPGSMSTLAPVSPSITGLLMSL